MRQLPFNGKKTKPAKLRKDYWRPMAVICFRPNFNRGVVGRSAFQMLREFRKLHELAWGDELLKSRKERGRLLNDQRKNAIADMAAVLAGRGRGNRMRECNNPPAKPWYQKPSPDSKRLYKATILWANKADRMYAREWTGNVTHDIMKEWYKGKRLNDPAAAQEEQQAEKKQDDKDADKTEEGKSAEKTEEKKEEEDKGAEKITGEGKEKKGAENIMAEKKDTKTDIETKTGDGQEVVAGGTVQQTGAPAIKATDTREPNVLSIPPPEESGLAGQESEAAALIALAHDLEAKAKKIAWENDPDRDLWSPDDEDKKSAGVDAEEGSKQVVATEGVADQGDRQKAKAEA